MSQASPLVGDLAQHLRGRILAGEFAADERVRESGVASEYGVARPTARSAIDILVGEGLLLRLPFSALRIPTVPLEELSEVVDLLAFAERAALERILRTQPDIRELRRAVGSSTHSFLDHLVQASGSVRLARLHRTATFELILGVNQNGLPAGALDTAPVKAATQRLADALSIEDAGAARSELGAILDARRALVPTGVRA